MISSLLLKASFVVITAKAISTNSINHKIISDCSNLVYAHAIFCGRWKVLILTELEGKKLRFSELKNIMSKVTERILSLQSRSSNIMGLSAGLCRQPFNQG
jgi:hypothetical protein